MALDDHHDDANQCANQNELAAGHMHSIDHSANNNALAQTNAHLGSTHLIEDSLLDRCATDDTDCSIRTHKAKSCQLQVTFHNANISFSKNFKTMQSLLNRNFKQTIFSIF